MVKKSRKANSSLKSWVAFVKKVQKEEHISYSSIGNFDEAFFTGTAIGIVPIKQIDNLIFNSIEIGKSLQKYYLDK